MNIVFTYHNGDCELAMESAKAIVAQGINLRHKATICCTNGTALVSEITEELKKVFPVVGRIAAQDSFDGWPLGPNQMFSDASNYCFQHEDPWMFWEPDCVPMRQNWVDTLEKEFLREPTKIMGSLIEGGTAPSGKSVHRLIVGSAVYPAKFLYGCTIAANLYNYNLRYRDAKAVPEPWDVRCRWEFLKYGRNTKLIQACWKSCAYRPSGNGIIFSACNADAEDIQSVTCPDKTVNPDAIIIHGCKDGSLHRMIYQPQVKPESVNVTYHVVKPLTSNVIVYGEKEKEEAQKFLNKLANLAVKKKVTKKRKTTKKKTPPCKK